MAVTRRLAAILAADVAGYSRLIGSDEQGTLQRLKAIRAELVDPGIAAHHGRIVKTTGDGLLAEFASTVDALRCADEIQTQMAERNFALAPDARIEFRIGVHQGDIVVEEDGDIFGDGVNIAARLEALAEQGGVCVSARVQEDAAGKLDLAFKDLGEQQLKNIARPVRAYAVGAAKPPRESAAIERSVPRLSIVVLPFANLSNDPEQEYFADGITEDLTTDLSRIPNMLVISRNTAFTYRDKGVSTRQISRELGVRYVLEGSVRRSQSRVRVTAQLIDAETDAHLWAERFDCDLGDLFALQDEVTARIANTLNVEFAVAEAARKVDRPDALDCIWRGRAARVGPLSRASVDEAIAWFERALALEPDSAEAQHRLARELVGRVQGFVPASSEADIERAEGLARRALAAAPRNGDVHLTMGAVLQMQRRYAEAISEYETALALNRNLVTAIWRLGRCKISIGKIDESIPLQEQALRLGPRDHVSENYFRIGEAHLLQSRLDQAIAWLEKSCRASPKVWYVHAWLAAACALTGDLQRARAELDIARTIQVPNFEAAIAHIAERFTAPESRAKFDTTIYAGLRLAGFPES
jgi:TolB-like protein/Tfp pilus assembly protein PilF